MADIPSAISGHKGWIGVIKAVTDRLQLIALIILVVESILIFSLYKSPAEDPLRVWYVVAMLLFFTVIVIGLFFDQYIQGVASAQSRHVDQQKEQAIQTTFESLGKRLLERYGVEAEFVSINVEILDLEGTTKETRIFRGIKVSENAPIPYIPFKKIIGKPGKFISHPKLVSYSLSNSQKAVSLRHIQKNENSSECRIEIEGLLHSQDGEFSYEIESQAKMFLMSKEEVDESYKDDEFKHEYVSQALDFVVKRLEIEVLFPENFNVKCHPGVFYGQAEFMHNLELQRVKLDVVGRRASCSIEEPLIGLSYLIYWTPPPRPEASK